MSATFAARAQTFGLDTPQPWALPVLKLLYSSPRVYAPLIAAWEEVFPGSRTHLHTLTEQGLVAHQSAVIVDTVAGKLASRPSRKVARYRLTAKGRRLVLAAREDMRSLTDAYPRIDPANCAAVLLLLEFFEVNDANRSIGYSAAHAVSATPLSEEVAKWWIRRALRDKLIKELPIKVADCREVVPEHYRITRSLSTQLKASIQEYPAWSGLREFLRLDKNSYLRDIDPARIGVSGATDYDHDVTAQRIAARAVTSATALPGSYFQMEPRFQLPILRRNGTAPDVITVDGSERLYYQPDAAFRSTRDHLPTISVLEYERFQTRKDAWNHLERFCGYVATYSGADRGADIRFVVDTKTRERGYVALAEAFADFALDNPDTFPTTPITIFVSSLPRIAQGGDFLADSNWYRIPMPPGRAEPDVGGVLLHKESASPYQQYFST